MWYLGLGLFSLAKIAVVFIVVFVYIPRKIFPQRAGATAIERFFENLVLMTFMSIILAHALSLLQIYSLTSLATVYLLVYLGVKWRSGGRTLKVTLRQWIVETAVVTFEVVDGAIDLRERVRAHVRRGRDNLTHWAGQQGNVLHAMVLLGIMGVAASLRFSDPLLNAALPFSDMYYHLEALKRFELGQPYWEDLYPKGLHAFLSVLHVTSGVDPVLVVKLVGPIVGLLIVASVYYAAFWLTRDANAALIGAAIAGIVDGTSSRLFENLGSNGWSWFFGMNAAAPFMANGRQTAALPQEFAMAFLLPALVLAHAYLTGDGNRSDLGRLFAGCMIVFASHSIVSVTLALGLTVLTAVVVVDRHRLSRIVGRGVVAYVLAGLLGNFQLVVGYWLRESAAHAENVRAEYAAQLAPRYTSWLLEWSRPLPVPPILYAACVIALCVGVWGTLTVHGRGQKRFGIFVGLFTLVLVFEICSTQFGIMPIMPPDRVGQYLGLLLPVGIGAVWNMITRGAFRGVPRWRVRPRQIVTVVACGVILAVAMPRGFASAPRYEYRSLAEQYHEIVRQYPPFQWMIVSSVGDYSKVLGRGWHMNASEFLSRFDPTAPRIDIPVRYTFVFVEKKPMTVSADDQTPRMRQDEERRLAEWVFIRSAIYGDLARYYEDNSVIVYLLQRHVVAS